MKMKLFVLTMLFSITAQAGSPAVFGLGFTAPTVKGTANVYNPQAGDIVYDHTSTAFWGFDHTSAWQQLTPPVGNFVATTNSGLRVEYVRVGSTCTSDPCIITSSSGSSVDSVSWSQQGVYFVNFVNGTFSAIPSCQVTSETAGLFGFSVSGSNTTDAIRVQFRNAADADLNSAFNVMCMGPQ